MSGKTALVVIASALAFGVSVSVAAEQQGIYQYPKGAKFCPLPGSDNQAFMQSYFAMDASTGEVTAVSSIENQPIDNSHLDTGEVVLLVAPSGNYENVFVPPERAGLASAPAVSMASPAYSAQGIYPHSQENQPLYAAAPQSSYSAPQVYSTQQSYPAPQNYAAPQSSPAQQSYPAPQSYPGYPVYQQPVMAQQQPYSAPYSMPTYQTPQSGAPVYYAPVQTAQAYPAPIASQPPMYPELQPTNPTEGQAYHTSRVPQVSPLPSVQVANPAMQPSRSRSNYVSPRVHPLQLPQKPTALAPVQDREQISEVAGSMIHNVKSDTTPPTPNEDDRIPWWKGGMWRNRKQGDDDRDSGASSKPANTNNTSRAAANTRSRDTGNDSASARSSGRNTNRPIGKAPRILDDDEMWDDDEYTGYNPDGSFGRPANAQRRPASRPDPRDNYDTARAPAPAPRPSTPPPPAGSPAPYPAPQPYPAQPQPYPAQPQPYPAQQPYYDPMGQQSGYAGAPYYDGGAYPAPQPMPSFSSDPYDTVPTIVLNDGGNAMGDPYGSTYGSAQTYSDPYGSSYGAATYATEPYATSGGSSYDAGGLSPYTATASADSGSWPLAPVSAPSYQGAPSIDAQGSPQFENAVRLVKNNRFSEAKSILVSETSRNPSNAAAWRWLADCHYNLLELEESLIAYQRALDIDANDYYALRGQGFSYLHHGHEYWRRMQDEVSRGEKEAAASTFARAHENYKKSLEVLGLCLRRAPNDSEAVYGEAMAAEGASRKLYSNAISYLKLGPEQRERAELFAENCLTVINKGIERSMERAKQTPGDAGPRALLGGLYLRKAILYHQLGKNDLALIELRNSRDVQNSILDEIDKNNESAQRNIQECDAYWNAWGGNS